MHTLEVQIIFHNQGDNIKRDESDVTSACAINGSKCILGISRVLHTTDLALYRSMVF